MGKLKKLYSLFLLLLCASYSEPTIDVSMARAEGLVIDTDDSIFVTGAVTVNGVQQCALAHYNSFGEQDVTFGLKGYTGIPVGSESMGYSLLNDPVNHRLVVAGMGTLQNNTFAVVACNSGGILDATFNNTGIVNRSIGSSAAAQKVVLANNGNYLVAGTSVIDGAPIVTVASYTIVGLLDATFGNNGIAIKRMYGSAGAYDCALQSTGKIVTAGFAITPSGKREFGLVRFNTDGSIDTTFGTTGTIVTGIGTDSCAYAMAIQSNDYIIAAGVSDGQFALARYQTNGSLDMTFGSSGIVKTAVGNTAQITDIILQKNGQIVAVGYSDNAVALARYTTNGSLDTNFGSNGLILLSVDQVAQARAVGLQSNSSIIVAGESNAGLILMQITPSGQLDTAFGNNGITRFPTISNAPDVFSLTDVNIASGAGIEYKKLKLANSITNTDISIGAAIADSKLASIATPGKIHNTATTATSENIGGSIVARDTLGNIAVNTISGFLHGNVQGAASDNVLKAGDEMSGPLVLPAGNAVAPSLQFSGSENTGFSATGSTLAISTNGYERATIANNGQISINRAATGISLLVEGNTQTTGESSIEGNIIFNTSQLPLYGVGTTQNAFTKVYAGNAVTSSNGTTMIDYTAAGFTVVPVICLSPTNGVNAALALQYVTNTSARVTSNFINIPFNYIALGV